MKKIRYSIFLIIISISFSSFSQSEYWVFLKDKAETTFDPYEYFDTKAIKRRIKNNVPLNDISDYPLNANYVNSVALKAESILGETRWFNAIAVVAFENQINDIKKLKCVNSVQQIYMQTHCAKKNKFNDELSETDLLIKQIVRMQGGAFVDNNITGKGVRIAIFDAGFPTVDTSPVFEHIRKDNRIIKTYDFKNKDENVYDYNMHGLAVMSCIGGIINGRNIGLATGAEFLLARTEFGREPLAEEVYWLQAVEWADKNGADIINSSLGYTVPRYFVKDMDGKTSLVVRAANMAAKKGILVVNAMGNDGTSDWKYAGTPADADSVLSIGGIDPETNYHISFSSYGPTADNRLKPNVSAFGDVIAAGKKGLTNIQGTSFASPLVAGFAACVLETNPKLTTMELFKEIEKSGNLYPYFDYAHGYGIPQASYFVARKKNKPQKSFEFKTEGEFVVVYVNEKFLQSQGQKNFLYYHIQKDNGVLEKYSIVDVYQKKALKINLSRLDNEKKLRVWFNDYVEVYDK